MRTYSAGNVMWRRIEKAAYRVDTATALPTQVLLLYILVFNPKESVNFVHLLTVMFFLQINQKYVFHQRLVREVERSCLRRSSQP